MGKNFAAAVLALVVGAGCYATGYGYSSAGYSSGYSGGTYVAYNAPPPAYVDVDVYYEPRPGYTYVNGRHNWVGNQWVWQDGYYVADRPGFVYTQGYWQGNRWYDGRWERQRPGYVYTGGYWDRGARGHRWVNGSWERQRNDHVYVGGRWSNNNGVRTYNRGRWERGSQARPARSSGPTIRDHRRR